MLRGWQEPAHVRSVLRRSINEQQPAHAHESGSVATVTMQETEFGRTAGEPDRGQQRESLGQILEAGCWAMEKMMGTAQPEFTPAERLGLECVLSLYARPSLLLTNNHLGAVPEMWNCLAEQREDVEMVQRGVGRLELMGHPEWNWAGTAFLINETTLMTTRRTAEIFCEMQGQKTWTFRPGITAWMDYNCEPSRQASARCKVRGVIGCHERYDLALLEVEPSADACPLVLSSISPAEMCGRPVYMVSFPVCDARRSEPETITRIFRDVYSCKRVNPGRIINNFRFGNVELMNHDCCTIGQTSGGCIFDMQTHQVVGMQMTSRYLECGTCVPVSVLRDDPMFTSAGVTFASTDSGQLGMMTQQLERLSRTRYWQDLCKTISDFYQKACPTK
jgi:hypothetical protein